MIRFALFLAVPVLMVTGCASKPTEIQAQYVSPLQYQPYNCSQVSAELQRVSRKSSALYGQLDKTASNDNAQMAIGLVLFWPTLFFLEGGDGPEAAEYARLKGEVDALVGCLVSSVTLSRSTSVIGTARERRTSRC